MDWLAEMFKKYPEFGVYLALGIGFLIGKLKYGGFSLGSVTGSLIGGMVVGSFFEVSVPSMAKSVLFLLFIFGIGYSVGPQFFKTMRGQGFKWVILSIFMCVVGLGGAYIVAKVINVELGYAAGLLSGGLTQSAAIGTATEAIKTLNLGEEETTRLVSQIAVADAICYAFGGIGIIIFCTTIGPKLLGINLEEEAAKLEEELEIERKKPGVGSAWHPFELRAYRVPAGAQIIGLTQEQAEKLMPDARLYVLRLRRGEEIFDDLKGMTFQEGDTLAIAGRREILVNIVGERAEEFADRELLEVPVEIVDVLVTGRKLSGRMLGEIGKDDAVRGVYLRHIDRGGQAIPISRRTEIQPGDVLTLVGPEVMVESAVKHIGKVIRPSDATDFMTVGFAIFAGALIGAAAYIPIGSTKITMGTTVGALAAGLLVGWFRTRRPLFGRIPDAAISFMTTFGLAAFVAMIGLSAGPHFIDGVKEAGVKLLFGGMLVTLLPLVAGLYFGKYVLKVNPLLLLGAIAGSQTFTPALAAVQERSKSPVAVLGYSGTVAVGNVLLTTWGTVIILLLS